MVLARLRACDRIEICAIVRSSRNFDPRFGFLRGALAYIRRCGMAYTLYLFCATTIADLLCGFTRIGRVPLGSRRGITVYTTQNINDAAGLAFLRSSKPDLLVSAFFDQRLQEPALAVSARACVNIHPSLLPEFRGVDPVLQAKLQRAPELGVTVHYMTPVLDAGHLLAQQAVAIPQRASLFEATALLFQRGATLLTTVVEQIAAGEAGAPQRRGGSYQSWPARSDIRALRRMRGRLVRWSDFSRLLARDLGEKPGDSERF
jgi:folate-dependent phosphoribosylglycinamide formyltransferase PurN